MTYKNGERFALNHHAGFITLRKDAVEKVNLEYFSKFMQNFYRDLSVSDGSKTLSLTQVYAEEFSLPSYDTQCDILNEIKAIEEKLNFLKTTKHELNALLEKEIIVDYTKYQGVNIPISECIDYISGSSKLTEEMNYQRLKLDGIKYLLLTGATSKEDSYVTLNDTIEVPKFEQKEGLLVTRKGKAGKVRYLPKGYYTLNDDAYILYVKDDSKYKINLQWLSIQYKSDFLLYSSNSDNGTWNMTGFFEHTLLDIPDIEEQLKLVCLYEIVNRKLNSIAKIEEMYFQLLNKEISY